MVARDAPRAVEPSYSTSPVVSSMRPLAQTLDRGRGVRDEADRAAALLELQDLADALALERLVADSEHLVQQQDVRVARATAIAKPSRMCIPDEYVRTGRSMNRSSSANATISSSRSRT